MGNHHAPETNPTGTPSPLSGSLYVTAAEGRYDAGEWHPLLFPHMDEEQAQRMADYLDTYISPEGGAYVTEYRNIRIAHCMFSELPEYNDTDPLT